ncbi:hypothetical protein ACFS5J_00290 [Flavobacterium chuncheonense]|uniref:Lipoprotein n=1 Tax=Flavobacterium chuncheonense TaxID=2026653 RepID=A0ABW5YIZ1_9FLAO
MKKINIINTLFVFLAVFSLASCNVEPIDPLAATQTGIPSASTGDYWPLAVGNLWSFSQNGSISDMEVTSTATINGEVYFNFDSLMGQSMAGNSVTGVASRAKKVGGDYYIKVEDFTFNAGGLSGTQTGFEYITLKDYLNVNETWDGSYQQVSSFSDPTFPSVTLNTTYIGKIVEKGTTLAVSGVTYTDVIHVEFTQTTTGTGQNVVTVTNFWFAKDVGPIKSTTSSQGATYESLLVDYILN